MIHNNVPNASPSSPPDTGCLRFFRDYCGRNEGSRLVERISPGVVLAAYSLIVTCAVLFTTFLGTILLTLELPLPITASLMAATFLVTLLVGNRFFQQHSSLCETSDSNRFCSI